MSTRILIIDDERDLCHLLKIIFQKEKFLVDCAYSLQDAGQKILLRPQIIFLDNNLPDGSGLDYYHDHPGEFIQSTVILITADNDALTKMKAMNAGITFYIQKPFSVKEIKVIIKKILSGNDQR
jgi:DNA-binding response OmpR family regulator